MDVNAKCKASMKAELTEKNANQAQIIVKVAGNEKNQDMGKSEIIEIESGKLKFGDGVRLLVTCTHSCINHLETFR